MAKRRKKAPARVRDGPFIELAVEHLRERLRLLRGVVPRRDMGKPALGCYHFDFPAEGGATVAATDLVVSLQLKLEVLRAEGVGRLSIQAQALDALLGAYPEPRIRLHLDRPAPERVTLRGLGAHLIVPGVEPDLVPAIPGSLTAAGLLVRGEDLDRALERTGFAADAKSTRFALNGVALFYPAGPGCAETMFLVATDGKRLARVGLAVRPHGAPTPTGGDTPAILVDKAVAVARKIARAAGEKAVGLAVVPAGPVDEGATKPTLPARLQVVTADAVLTARLVEGRFPHYQDVWPEGEPIAELHLRSALDLAGPLKLAAAGTDRGCRGCEIVLADGSMLITVESDDGIVVDQPVPVPGSTGRATISLDAVWLREFLDHAGDVPVVGRIFDPTKAVLFDAGDDFSYVLMPLTGKDKDVPAPPPEPEPPAAGDGNDQGGGADEPPPPPPAPEPEPVAPVKAARKGAHRKNGRAKAVRRAK